MSNVSEKVLQAMYNHLIMSYSADEAKDLLIQKYPDAEADIELLVAEAEGDDIAVNHDSAQADIDKLQKAVKAKVEAKPKAKKAAKPKAEKQPKVAKPKGEKGSKVDQARDLYIAATDRSRTAIIELFMQKVGLTKAGASTYYYNLKKQLGDNPTVVDQNSL